MGLDSYSSLETGEQNEAPEVKETSVEPKAEVAPATEGVVTEVTPEAKTEEVKADNTETPKTE
jgi:hypothetical protein